MCGEVVWQRDFVDEGGVAEVQDQRIVSRPLLGFENAPHRLCIETVRAQPVDGFGGEGDQAAGA